MRKKKVELKDDKIDFRLTQIQIISKILEPQPVSGVQGVYFFDIKVENRVQPKNNLVIAMVYSNIRYEQSEQPLAKFVIACIFEVIDFTDKILMNKSGVYAIPPHLDRTIKPLSISTARGIIFSELRGTYLNNAIMPVIYISDLQDNPVQEAMID